MEVRVVTLAKVSRSRIEAGALSPLLMAFDGELSDCLFEILLLRLAEGSSSEYWSELPTLRGVPGPGVDETDVLPVFVTARAAPEGAFLFGGMIAAPGQRGEGSLSEGTQSRCRQCGRCDLDTELSVEEIRAKVGDLVRW